MKFGELIKVSREQAGLSRIQLADLIELSVSYIRDIERSNRYPSDIIVSKLIDKLNLDKSEAIKCLSLDRGYIKFDINDLSDSRNNLVFLFIKIWNLPDSDIESICEKMI